MHSQSAEKQNKRTAIIREEREIKIWRVAVVTSRDVTLVSLSPTLHEEPLFHNSSLLGAGFQQTFAQTQTLAVGNHLMDILLLSVTLHRRLQITSCGFFLTSFGAKYVFIYSNENHQGTTSFAIMSTNTTSYLTISSGDNIARH